MNIGDGGSESPWAGDVPVPAAPLQIEWPSAKNVREERSVEQSGAPHTEPSDAPHIVVGSVVEGAPHGDVTADEESRRNVLIAVAALATLVFGVLLVSVVNNSGDPEGDAASVEVETEPEDAEPATTVEQTNDSLPTVDDESDVSTTIEERDGAPSTLDEDVVVVRPDVATSLPDVELPPNIWVRSTIDVPPGLDDMAVPTTLVALTADRQLHEITLPSGDVSSISIDAFSVTQQFVVGPTATLVTGRSGLALIPTDGVPIDVDVRGAPENLVALPGARGFAGVLFEPTAIDSDRVIIQLDGTVVDAPIPVPDLEPWQLQYGPGGQAIVFDAGGLYGIADDGTTQRISTGFPLALTSRHVLARECDETRVCAAVLIDAAGDRTVVDIDDALTIGLGAESVTVSPDGRSMRFLNFESDEIIDLENGERQAIGARAPSSRAAPNFDWAADSSGIFRATDELIEFVGRDSGESVSLGGELGDIMRVAVRDEAVPLPSAEPAPLVTGLQLVAYGPEGALSFIDVDAETAFATPVPPLRDDEDMQVVVDAAGATVTSVGSDNGVRLDAITGEVRDIEFFRFGDVWFPGPQPGTVWRKSVGFSAAPEYVYVLLNALGESLDQFITIPGEHADDDAAFGSDGAGNIAVRSKLGGVFVFGPAGGQRLTTGTLIASNASIAYARECDDVGECGVVAVDRLSGDRTAFTSSFADVIDSDRSTRHSGQRLSPDGQVIMAFVRGPVDAWGVLDTQSEQLVTVPTPDPTSVLLWTDDSQSAVFLSEQQLHLYDRASASVRVLDLPNVSAFAELSEELVEQRSTRIGGFDST